MISDLGIVIVNWNSGKELKRCLESIEGAGYMENVLVVDNGSKNRFAVHGSRFKVKTIENKENLGYGGGNNVGIKYFLDKKKKFILILNPDTEIYKNTIPNLLKVMEEDKVIGIIGPKIYASLDSSTSLGMTKEGKIIWSAGGIIDKNRYSGGLIGLGQDDCGQYEKLKEVDFVSGTAMLIRSEVFEKIGLFEKLYFMYYEDVEFCQKAKKAGFRVKYVPTAKILHCESSSIGKNSPKQEYYMARNHLLFVERNAPIIIRFREVIRLIKTIYEYYRKGEKYALLGIKDYYFRRFGRYDYRS